MPTNVPKFLSDLELSRGIDSGDLDYSYDTDQFLQTPNIQNLSLSGFPKVEDKPSLSGNLYSQISGFNQSGGNVEPSDIGGALGYRGQGRLPLGDLGEMTGQYDVSGRVSGQDMSGQRHLSGSANLSAQARLNVLKDSKGNPLMQMNPSASIRGMTGGGNTDIAASASLGVTGYFDLGGKTGVTEEKEEGEKSKVAQNAEYGRGVMSAVNTIKDVIPEGQLQTSLTHGTREGMSQYKKNTFEETGEVPQLFSDPIYKKIQSYVEENPDAMDGFLQESGLDPTKPMKKQSMFTLVKSGVVKKLREATGVSKEEMMEFLNRTGVNWMDRTKAGLILKKGGKINMVNRDVETFMRFSKAELDHEDAELWGGQMPSIIKLGAGGKTGPPDEIAKKVVDVEAFRGKTLKNISEHESSGDPNAKARYKTNENLFPNISTNTMGENWNEHNNTALGKYQIQRDTAKDVLSKQKDELGNRLYSDDDIKNMVFNEENQEMIANLLLDRRGIKEYAAGTLKLDSGVVSQANQFGLNLAKEWAYQPKDSTGITYYSEKDSLGNEIGDNRAGITFEDQQKLIGLEQYQISQSDLDQRAFDKTTEENRIRDEKINETIATDQKNKFLQEDNLATAYTPASSTGVSQQFFNLPIGGQANNHTAYREEGGMVEGEMEGPSHEQGGIPVEVEGGERVFSVEATETMEQLVEQEDYAKLGQFVAQEIQAQDSRDQT